MVVLHHILHLYQCVCPLSPQRLYECQSVSIHSQQLDFFHFSRWVNVSMMVFKSMQRCKKMFGGLKACLLVPAQPFKGRLINRCTLSGTKCKNSFCWSVECCLRECERLNLCMNHLKHVIFSFSFLTFEKESAREATAWFTVTFKMYPTDVLRTKYLSSMYKSSLIHLTSIYPSVACIMSSNYVFVNPFYITHSS